MSVFSQAEFAVRFEWGLEGVRALAPTSEAVVVVVDVLSFSTCVSIAMDCGAVVYPFRWKDESARQFASSIGAELAGARGSARSLSPASMKEAAPGESIVLPSPNGAALSLEAASLCRAVFTGCLRNAGALATAAVAAGKSIAVIAAGERWPDGSLRPALEDLLGAGAIINACAGNASPEARAAGNAFSSAVGSLKETLMHTASGKELMDIGYADDVGLAAELDVSGSKPRLIEGAFV